jgi:hypothetical protein
MGFNKPWNLVRDQGVGGSNPLSPTILFSSRYTPSKFPKIPAVGKNATALTSLICHPYSLWEGFREKLKRYC